MQNMVLDLNFMRRESYKAQACTKGTKIRGYRYLDIETDVSNSNLISYNEDLSFLDTKTGCRLEVDAERA